MKVEQHRFLSDAALALRRRDGIRPWMVHPCEVDHFKGMKPGEWPALDEARKLREELEAT